MIGAFIISAAASGAVLLLHVLPMIVAAMFPSISIQTAQVLVALISASILSRASVVLSK